MTRALTSFLFVLSTTALSAQANDDAWEGYRDARHRDACRLAHQVLTDGQPADKREWALSVIPSCGPLGGEAVATLLHEHRYATERTHEYETIVLLATRLTDRSIYEAAMELSRDPEATELARIQAIRAVYYQVRPGDFADYDVFVTPGMVSFGSTYHANKGEPLPENAFVDILTAMNEIDSDPEVSEPLRTAAQMTRGAVRARLRVREECGGVSLQECMRRMGIIPE